MSLPIHQFKSSRRPLSLWELLQTSSTASYITMCANPSIHIIYFKQPPPPSIQSQCPLHANLLPHPSPLHRPRSHPKVRCRGIGGRGGRWRWWWRRSHPPRHLNRRVFFVPRGDRMAVWDGLGRRRRRQNVILVLHDLPKVLNRLVQRPQLRQQRHVQLPETELEMERRRRIRLDHNVTMVKID